MRTLSSDIPIPERLLERPRTENNYPTLFTTAYVDGKPDLRLSEQELREQCFHQKLCGICGQKLDYWMYFVTGELGVKNRIFADPPNHLECLNYAMLVCPFLGGVRASYTAPKDKNLVLACDPTAERENLCKSQASV